MLISLLQGGSIAKHDKAILGSCQGDIHPSPIGEESNPSVMVGPYCRKDDQITLPALVSTAKNNNK